MKFCVFLLLILGVGFNWASPSCLGVWRTENQQADIQFVACGDGFVCGVVIRASKEFTMANWGDTLIHSARCSNSGQALSDGVIRTNQITAKFNAFQDSKVFLNVEISKFMFTKKQRWKKIHNVHK